MDEYNSLSFAGVCSLPQGQEEKGFNCTSVKKKKNV